MLSELERLKLSLKFSVSEKHSLDLISRIMQIENKENVNLDYPFENKQINFKKDVSVDPGEQLKIF